MEPIKFIKKCYFNEEPLFPNINFLQAELRQLRVNWTPELAQDLSTFHNIDAEAELTALLSQRLTNEINRQIVNDILNIHVGGYNPVTYFPFELPEIDLVMSSRFTPIDNIGINGTLPKFHFI